MARCPHGFDEEGCLICQVLGGPDGTAGTDRPGRRVGGARTGGTSPPTVTAEPGTARTRLRRAGRPMVPRPTPSPPIPRRRFHPLASLVTIAVALVAVLIAVWVLAGAFFAALRVVELVAVALVAGWVGYRVGHWRGRHER